MLTRRDVLLATVGAGVAGQRARSTGIVENQKSFSGVERVNDDLFFIGRPGWAGFVVVPLGWGALDPLGLLERAMNLEVNRFRRSTMALRDRRPAASFVLCGTE